MWDEGAWDFGNRTEPKLSQAHYAFVKSKERSRRHTEPATSRFELKHQGKDMSLLSTRIGCCRPARPDRHSTSVTYSTCRWVCRRFPKVSSRGKRVRNLEWGRRVEHLPSARSAGSLSGCGGAHLADEERRRCRAGNLEQGTPLK